MVKKHFQKKPCHKRDIYLQKEPLTLHVLSVQYTVNHFIKDKVR